MAPGDTARLYHRLSSYSGDPAIEWPTPIDHPLVRQDFAPNDRPTFPAHRKVYPDGLPSVELPAAWAPVHAPTIDLLAGRHASVATPLDLEGLARLLHLSAGVVRVAVRRDGRRFLFRPAGSAGGLFPLELYVAARGVSGLRDGVYWYDPVGHSLRLVAPPATGDATTIVVTGIPWRTGWRYAERGFRHIYWDAGTMLANTLALAESGGYRPRLLTRFPDAAVARLVGADGTQEFPLAIVTPGPRRAGDRPRRRGSNRRDRRGTGRVPARDARPARRRRRAARRAVADRAAGRRRPAGDRRPRRGHPASRLGADARCDGRCRLPDVRAIARRIASRNPGPALHRRPCRRGARSRTLPLAGPRASGATRFAPGRAVGRLLRAGPGARRLVRRHRRGRPGPASTTAGTARPSSMPASWRAACIWPRTRSASAHPG